MAYIRLKSKTILGKKIHGVYLLAALANANSEEWVTVSQVSINPQLLLSSLLRSWCPSCMSVC